MPAQNPLTKAPVNSYGTIADPPNSPSPEEVERRVQELWNQWLKAYFKAGSFVTKDGLGGTRDEDFEQCVMLFGQGSLPDPPKFPVIHYVVQDQRFTKEDRREGFNGFNGRFVWNVLVRVGSQAGADGADGDVVSNRDAGTLCRRVADQLRSLLVGTEKEALSERGVGRVRLVRGPIEIASGKTFIRQLVVSHEAFYETENPAKL